MESLDKNGLQRFWNHIVSHVGEAINNLGELSTKNRVSKNDLDTDLQASINKANSALQAETDPTVPAWAKASTKPKYTASEVGADASGTANTAVSNHNINTSAHSDIRTLITNLTTRLNTLADSDDTTLDQMSEVVAYIKSNKSLIEGITTNKVNVSDIINNLTTNVTNKPLSAAQGVELKRLITLLETEVGKKALSSDLTTHTNNENIHIPSCSTTNNGQFLRVVGGKASWSTVPNAEEASF